MSSPSRVRAAKAGPQLQVVHNHSPRFYRGKKIALAVIVVIIIGLIVVLCSRIWPYSRESVLQSLAEASDSAITIQGFHKTYFPPGCVIYGMEFHHGRDQFELVKEKEEAKSYRYTFLGLTRNRNSGWT